MPKEDYNWTYVLTAKRIVLTREFTHELAKKMRDLNLSRQKSIDWLDQKLFHELDAPVHLIGGKEFHVYPGIYEDAYGESFEYRWNTDIKRHADCLPQRAPNKSLLLRLWLWDLAFKVADDPIRVKL